MSCNDLIIKDSEFLEVGKIISTTAEQIDNAVTTYKHIMNRVCSEYFVSGETRDALFAFIDYIEKLEGSAKSIGSKANLLCALYIDDIERADGDLYDGRMGDVVRDFSANEKALLLAIVKNPFYKWTSITDRIGDWIIKQISNLNMFQFIKYSDRKFGLIKIALLDYNDMTARKIRDIFQRVEAVERRYGGKNVVGYCSSGSEESSYFYSIFNSFHVMNKILMKMNEIIKPGSGKFRADTIHHELGSLFVDLQQCVDEVNEISPPGIEIDIWEIEKFVSDRDNILFFQIYSGVYSDFLGEIGIGDTLSMAIFQHMGIDTANLIGLYTRPDGVAEEDTYKYNLIKKELADTINEIAGNELNIDEIEAYYDDAKKIYGAFKSGEEVDWVFKGIYEGIGDIDLDISAMKGIGMGIDAAELAIPLFANYLRNKEIIQSIASNVDKDSLTGIAISELQAFYDDKYLATIQDGIDVLLEYGFDIGFESVLALFGSSAGGLFSLAELGLDIIGEISGIGTSSKNLLNFICVEEAASSATRAYEDIFLKILNGSPSEQDYEELKNSFQIAKKMNLKALEYIVGYYEGKGNFDKMSYYEYLIKDLENLHIDSGRKPKYVSFETYMSY